MDPSSTTASSESSFFSGLEIEMVGLEAMKRIPLIKFPRRHPKPSASGSSSQTQAAARDGDAQQIFISRLDVQQHP
ncbi:hypothetical protein F0562_030949 [Nyssa sinensis]|uniref:Uncharacterized protein n=1 Tax=Nyssa sinensis TaxID=561372 RepID=A0A5J5AVW8_9ASTE|nr:hypothetical protein F0562_030949 [Nyssa sinensis]